MRTTSEPLINLKLGPQGEETTFLIDTGAERSTVRHIPPGCQISKDTMLVVGAKGEPFRVPIIKDIQIESKTRICVGNFLLVEEAENNLLGRDLIIELGISLEIKKGTISVNLYQLTEKDEECINPEVWHHKGEIGKLDIDPLEIEITDLKEPIRVRQYPISLDGRQGLKPIIEDLIQKGTLEPCKSPQNTPILPVRKPDGSYRLVQNVRAVNQRTVTWFPVVANPYTLLNRISPEHTWYSVTDLKDAFWACPLAEKSRNYFAFEWEDPETGRKQQLRWTVLPQGFTESPNLFGQALENLLASFTTKGSVRLLQYVDDLLIAGKSEEEVRENTVSLLNFLGEKGLKVSKSKLQFTEPEVKYLGHWISKGKKKLDPDRVAGIIALPAPKTKREIRQLLGLLGYC